MDSYANKIPCRQTVNSLPHKLSHGLHPVERGTYLINTLEIVNFNNILRKWIDKGIAGALLYGEPRVGKTFAINYLIQLFSLDFPEDIKVYRCNCQKFGGDPNENYFFEFLLRDVGHELFSLSKATAKRERLIKFLLIEGLKSKSKKILLFLDEAQRLNAAHYKHLMNIQNELSKYGVGLIYIFVGQQELKSQITLYDLSTRCIVTNLVNEEYKISGVKKLKELKYILSVFDKNDEFTKHNDFPFTHYFFPIGYLSGHRLEHFADSLWEIFIKLNSKYGARQVIEIPIYYIISVINIVLYTYGTSGENLDWINLSHWKKSIEESEYRNFQRILYGQ